MINLRSPWSTLRYPTEDEYFLIITITITIVIVTFLVIIRVIIIVITINITIILMMPRKVPRNLGILEYWFTKT